MGRTSGNSRTLRHIQALRTHSLRTRDLIVYQRSRRAQPRPRSRCRQSRTAQSARSICLDHRHLLLFQPPDIHNCRIQPRTGKPHRSHCRHRDSLRPGCLPVRPVYLRQRLLRSGRQLPPRHRIHPRHTRQFRHRRRHTHRPCQSFERHAPLLILSKADVYSRSIRQGHNGGFCRGCPRFDTTPHNTRKTTISGA